jgi:hypothetical protein
MRQNALLRAQGQTSERSSPGRTRVYMVMSTASVFDLSETCHVDMIMKVRLARRSRPAPQQQADHKPVASLLTGRAVRRPGRQAEHLATRPHHREFANRIPDQPRRATPTGVPDGEARARRSDLPRPSPTDRRDGDPEPRQPRQLAPLERRRRAAMITGCAGGPTRRRRPFPDQDWTKVPLVQECAVDVDVSGVHRRFHPARVYVVRVDGGRVGITTTGAHRTRLAFTIANATITRTDPCFEHPFD